MNSNCFMKNKHIKLFFDIKKEDRLNICIGFTLFLIIMIAYYILKPLRGSTTIKRIGPEGLAYGYILSSFSALIFSIIYSKISRCLKRDHLIIYTIIFFGVAFIILRFLFEYFAGSIFICMVSFVLISIYSVTMVTNLWSLLNDIVLSQDAKRFYSFICFGAMLGSTIGSHITQLLVKHVGTNNLFLVSSATIFCMIPLFSILSRKNLQKEDKGFITKEINKQKAAVPDKIAKKQILFIALVLVLGLISTTMGNLQFSSLVDKRFVKKNSEQQTAKVIPKQDNKDNKVVLEKNKKPNVKEKKNQKVKSSGDDMTFYLAGVYKYMSYLGLFALLFLGSPIFKLIGPSRILMLQPILLLTAAIWFIMDPLLIVCAIFIILYGGLGYSIHQVSREMMYIPLARQYKYTLKNYVDVFGFRFAAAYGSIMFLIMNKYYEVGIVAYSYVILVCSILMSFSVYKIHKSYQYIIKNFYAEDNV